MIAETDKQKWRVTRDENAEGPADLMLPGADEADSNGPGCCRNQSGARIKHAAKCAHASNREESARNQQRGRNDADTSRQNERKWERRGVKVQFAGTTRVA